LTQKVESHPSRKRLQEKPTQNKTPFQSFRITHNFKERTFYFALIIVLAIVWQRDFIASNPF